MNVAEFLQEQLTSQSHYTLTEQDNDLIEKHGIKSYIYKKLVSKKFRRWSLDNNTEERIIKAINIAVDNSLPLQVIFPQGAYKLWRLESSPEVDWAEFFNIAHLINYLAPIAAAYSKGIQLYYYMHSLVPEVHDNLPVEDINRYLESFQGLLDEFSHYLPSNFGISISKDVDFYNNRDEYFEELEAGFEKGKADFYTSPEEKQRTSYVMSELNIKFDGKEDLTGLNEEERKERILRGAFYEKALAYLTKPRAFTKADDKVLLFVKSGGGFLGIGTTKVSLTKYWTGTGIAEQRGDTFYGRILSPKQFELVKDNLTYEPIHLIEGLKNFSTIGIYNGELNFVHD